MEISVARSSYAGYAGCFHSPGDMGENDSVKQELGRTRPYTSTTSPPKNLVIPWSEKSGTQACKSVPTLQLEPGSVESVRLILTFVRRQLFNVQY